MLGTTINGLHIVEKLGEGGMAEVYRAVDLKLERDVAIKFLRATARDPEQQLKRFEIEAKALAKLRHPNIVTVLGYGEHENQPYLVMEYVPGGTLKDMLGQPMEPRKAAKLLAPIARALHYAHEKNIIHRDVKPSNILITESGEPMLSDFGVAKMLGLEETMDLTGTSVGIGTPYYMSPEQGRNREIGPQSDVYSLGVVLYEMVTGRKPYEAETPLAVILKHIEDPLPNLAEQVRGLPKDIERTIYAALAKKPTERFKSMHEMAETLEQGRLGGGQLGGLKLNRRAGTGVVLGLLVLAGLYFISQIGDKWNPLAFLSAGGNSSKTNPLDDAELVHLPAGTYTMGNDEGEANQRPAHEVYLDEFWIYRTEVTNAQFARFVEATNYDTEAEERGQARVYNNGAWVVVTGASWQHPTGSLSNISGLENHPVGYITRQDAETYCAWAGARLPTEAEWEKAAGAGAGDGRLYPWGSDISAVLARYSADSAAAVGSYPAGASPYGVLDMLGNVAEWVSDWYSVSYYSRSPAENPAGPASGEYGILRGSGWAHGEHQLGVAVRQDALPMIPFDYMGFRCALSDSSSVGSSSNDTGQTGEPVSGQHIYLATLTPTFKVVGFGEYSVDTYAFSETGTVSLGDPIEVHGVRYKNTILAHARSLVRFSLGGHYDQLVTGVAMHKWECTDGAEFIVKADGIEILATGLVTHRDPIQYFTLDISGAETLELLTLPGTRDDVTCDWSYWVEPYLITGN